MLLALWAALLQCCQVNPCMNTEGYLSFFLFFFFLFLVSEDMLTIYIMHRCSFNCLCAWPSCVSTALEVLWIHKWLIIWDGCKGVPWCSSPGIVSNSGLVIAWKQINSTKVKITQPFKNGRSFQRFVHYFPMNVIGGKNSNQKCQTYSSNA